MRAISVILLIAALIKFNTVVLKSVVSSIDSSSRLPLLDDQGGLLLEDTQSQSVAEAVHLEIMSSVDAILTCANGAFVPQVLLFKNDFLRIVPYDSAIIGFEF